MTTKLNALSYADALGQDDLITVSRSVVQDSDFRLGNGSDILVYSDTGPAAVHGIDVWTGVGNDVVRTSNGDDTIYANGGGKKFITTGSGADDVHLDMVNIASSFIDLHDTDQKHDTDTVFFFGGQLNTAGGVGSHTIENVGIEDTFQFKSYGNLFFHNVDNTVTGAFDFITRGTFDGPVVAKIAYEPELNPVNIHPTLEHDGFQHFTLHFDLHA